MTFADGRTTPFAVVAADPISDVAVIRAQGISGLTPLTLGTSGTLRVGQQVLAVGSPRVLRARHHRHRQCPGSPGLDRERRGGSAHNARRHPNRCPDESGQLRWAAGRYEWPGDRDELGNGQHGPVAGRADWFDRSGFAISVDQAKRIADQLIATGKASHASLGVQVADAGESPDGAQILGVASGGAAAAAGLPVGAVITKVDGQVIDNADALGAVVLPHPPADEVSVNYVAPEGDTRTAHITLGSDEGQQSS